MKNLLLILCIFALFSCKQNKPVADASRPKAEKLLWSESKNGITVTEVYSLQFPEAKLVADQPLDGTTVNDDSVMFSYEIENYQLGAMTGDYSVKRCANSAQGQHIHHILNNEPYTAHYTESFKKKLNDGHYVNLSFLSRSYHESLKQPAAYQLSQFVVGKGMHNPVDLNRPIMFYSRPKGEYKGDDTEKILLDFYLVNANLEKRGYNVRATINGTPFLLTKWVPYTIEGLPMGENKIKLELLDKNGELVNTLFNPVERKITLAAK